MPLLRHFLEPRTYGVVAPQVLDLVGLHVGLREAPAGEQPLLEEEGAQGGAAEACCKQEGPQIVGVHLALVAERAERLPEVVGGRPQVDISQVADHKVAVGCNSSCISSVSSAAVCCGIGP